MTSIHWCDCEGDVPAFFSPLPARDFRSFPYRGPAADGVFLPNAHRSSRETDIFGPTKRALLTHLHPHCPAVIVLRTVC